MFHSAVRNSPPLICSKGSLGTFARVHIVIASTDHCVYGLLIDY